MNLVTLSFGDITRFVFGVIDLQDDYIGAALTLADAFWLIISFMSGE